MGPDEDGYPGVISHVKEREQIHHPCGRLCHEVGEGRGLAGSRCSGGGRLFHSRNTAAVWGPKKLNDGLGQVFHCADDATGGTVAANELSYNNGVPPAG